MNSEELNYCEEISKRLYNVHDHSSPDCWKSHPECMVLKLVDEIRKLKIELESAKSYDYRSYAPLVWHYPGYPGSH